MLCPLISKTRDSPTSHVQDFCYGFHALKERSPKSLIERNTSWLQHRVPDNSASTVLIADDSESDIFFLLRAFSASRVRNPIIVVRSGQETIDYLSGAGKFANRARFPLPRIVFVDLKMPDVDGLSVLRWKKEQSQLPRMLWVALSNFDSTRTINEAYASGATTFLTKPLDGNDVRHLIESFDDYWLLQRGEEKASANEVAAQIR